jgi:phenylpropionate dioxygenase-like ring-hydroxylating dioxygenase large terminal subunit
MSKLFDYWYIISKESELKTGSFTKKKLLGKDLILIKNDQNNISVLEDRCCHRNVHLSLGHYDNGLMTCAYHGWSYNEVGKCVDIPSIDSSKIPKTACIESFKSETKYGFIWICINPQSNKKIPDLAELEELPFTEAEYIFQSDLMFVSESLIDPYHINHVHSNSIGSFMGDLNKDLIEVQINHKDEKLYGSYKRRNNLSAAEKIYFSKEDYIDTEFEFIFPNISKLDIRFPKRRLVIYEHIVEVDDGLVSMREISAWDNIFPISSHFARFFMKRKSKKIVSEDLAFMKSHAELKEKSEHKDVHTKADVISIEFRKHWQRCLND